MMGVDLNMEIQYSVAMLESALRAVKAEEKQIFRTEEIIPVGPVVKGF